MSTTRFIPVSNWTTALAQFIRESKDGDEIVCRNEAQRQLAERAIARMCPDKQIVLSVVTEEEWNAPLESGRALPV